jgi:hypothetical protein
VAPLRQSNAIRCAITGQSPAQSERRGPGHRPARPSAAQPAEGSSAAGDTGRRDGAAPRRRPGHAPLSPRPSPAQPAQSFRLSHTTASLLSASRLHAARERPIRCCIHVEGCSVVVLAWCMHLNGPHLNVSIQHTRAHVLAGGMAGQSSSRQRSRSRRCARQLRASGAPKAATRAPRPRCRTPGELPCSTLVPPLATLPGIDEHSGHPASSYSLLHNRCLALTSLMGLPHLRPRRVAHLQLECVWAG